MLGFRKVYSTRCAFCCPEALAIRNNIIYEDNDIFAMTDLRPRATVHLLVISRLHIPSVEDLRVENIELLQHMIHTGKSLLATNGLKSHQQQLGFHRPPFTSVHHLHLHCLGLPFAPSWNRVRFTPSLIRSYIDAESVLQELEGYNDESFPCK